MSFVFGHGVAFPSLHFTTPDDRRRKDRPYVRKPKPQAITSIPEAAYRVKTLRKGQVAQRQREREQMMTLRALAQPAKHHQFDRELEMQRSLSEGKYEALLVAQAEAHAGKVAR